MPKPQRLWSASFAVAPESAAFFSDVLGEEALALTVMAPPRTGKAEIEAIFDAPPDAAALQTRLAILSILNGMTAPKLTIRELPKLDWLKKVAEDFPPLPIARWVVYGAQHKAAAEECRRLRSRGCGSEATTEQSRLKIKTRSRGCGSEATTEQSRLKIKTRSRGCGEPTKSAYHRAVAPYIGLQIDATSAFGTGEHPTTRGCLLMLDWLLTSGFKAHSMLDMGCGSGILAMAYAKACRGQAVGVDLDSDSVAIAKGNIRANGLREHMRVVLGNGYKTPLVRRAAPYDLIMANIFAGPLCRMAHDLKKHLKPEGRVILSGILTPQAARVIAAHRRQGLYLSKHLKIGEWSVLALKRPSKAE